MKTCNKCKIEKDISEFYKNKSKEDGYNYICKSCDQERHKKYYIDNKEKIKKYHKKWYKDNKNYILEQEKLYRSKNKNKISTRNKVYRSINKDKLEKYFKEYRDNNKDKIKKYYNNNKEKLNKQRKIYYKDYYLNNKDKIIKKHTEYSRTKRKTDPNYRLLDNLRRRIRTVLKNNSKSDRTINLIGCSIGDLKIHLQQTAISNGYKNFDINNYNGKDYHIDHIVPCSEFNLKCSYHQKLCFNWSNMQILSAEENILKSDKTL